MRVAITRLPFVRPMAKQSPVAWNRLGTRSFASFQTPLQAQKASCVLPRHFAASSRLLLSAPISVSRHSAGCMCKRNPLLMKYCSLHTTARSALDEREKKSPAFLPPRAELTKLEKLTGLTNAKIYHLTTLALAGAVPLYAVLTFFVDKAPATLALPVDLTLAVVVPLHATIGLYSVIEDYLPKSVQPPLYTFATVLAFLMVLGLVKITLFGPGIIETTKTLWRKPAPEEIEDKKETAPSKGKKH